MIWAQAVSKASRFISEQVISTQETQGQEDLEVAVAVEEEAEGTEMTTSKRVLYSRNAEEGGDNGGFRERGRYEKTDRYDKFEGGRDKDRDGYRKERNYGDEKEEHHEKKRSYHEDDSQKQPHAVQKEASPIHGHGERSGNFKTRGGKDI